MPITKQGSQFREPIGDTEYWVVGECDCGVVLHDSIFGHFQVWAKRDDYAGYVLEIDGVGYEFVRKALPDDLWSAGIDTRVHDVVLVPM
jgi:hypothetical protein